MNSVNRLLRSKPLGVFAVAGWLLTFAALAAAQQQPADSSAETPQPGWQELVISGDARAKANDHEAAYQMYSRAAKAAPDEARVQGRLALGCLNTQRRTEGLAALERFFTLSPASRNEPQFQQIHKSLEALPQTPPPAPQAGTTLEKARRELDRQIELHAKNDVDTRTLKAIRDRLSQATDEPLDRLARRRLAQLTEAWPTLDPSKREGVEAIVAHFTETREMMQRHPGQIDIAAIRAETALAVGSLPAAWEAGRVMILFGAAENGTDAQLDLLLKLRTAGLDTWSWTDAWSRGRRELAKGLFGEARAVADTISDAWGKASTLRSIAEAQARASDVVGAKATFKAAIAAVGASSENADGKAYWFCNIAEAQAGAGDVAGASATLESALATVDTIADAVRKDTRLAYISAVQAKALNVAGAKGTASSIADGNSKALAFLMIARAQARAGDVAGAIATVGSIHTTGLERREHNHIGRLADSLVQADTLGAIAEAQAKAGNLAGAKATAGAISDASHKARALCDIAKAQAKAGDIAGAKATADTISKADSKASALREIAEAQAKAGDVAGAKATADTIGVAIHKAFSLHAIVIAQAKLGDMAGAGETFKAAKTTTDVIADSIDKYIFMRYIAEAQARAGDVVGATATASAIAHSDYKESAISAIAEAQAEAGNVAGASETLKSALSRAGTNEFSDRWFALQQIRLGDIPMALIRIRSNSSAFTRASGLSHVAANLMDPDLVALPPWQ